MAGDLGVLLASADFRDRVFGKIAGVVQRSRRAHVLAGAVINKAKQAGDLGQLTGVRHANAAHDVHDEPVLKALEHRRGDQQSKERQWLTSSERLRLDGKVPDTL